MGLAVLLHKKRQRARDDAPERGAHPHNDHPTEGDQKGDERGFTVPFIVNGGRHGAANGP